MTDLVFYSISLLLILVALLLGFRALFMSKHMHASVKYLAWFMIYVTWTNIQNWIFVIDPSPLYPGIALFFFPLELLPAPFFLLFLVSFLGDNEKIVKRRFWLFIVFWIFMVLYVFMKIDIIKNGLSYSETREQYFSLIKLEEIVTMVYGMGVCVYSYYIIKRFEDKRSHLPYILVIAKTAWFKKVLRIGVGLLFLWVICLFVDSISILEWGYYAYIPSWAGYLLFIIYIGYAGFIQTSVLREREIINQSYKDKTVPSPEFKNIQESSNSTDKHFSNIELLMKEKKAFLNPYLDLNTIAEEVGISPNYVSKIINAHAQVNFSDYVNTYRIAFAKNMLSTPAFENYNILSIALEAGFNSKSSFYKAFRKLTGDTPSHYKAKVKANNLS